MDVLEFFNTVNEKSWKQQIEPQLEARLEIALDSLLENKDLLRRRIMQSVNSLRSLYESEGDEFSYESFERWSKKFIIEEISKYLEEEYDS